MKPWADLTPLINPHNIVVVGASPRVGSQGRRLYDNLVLHSSVPGQVYPVNPAHQEIDGEPCWPAVSALPADASIDVALVMVNAVHVLDVLKQCAARHIPFAIVMTSGFSEAGETGQVLEQEIAELCRDTGLRVYGPNCPGLVNVRDRIGMTFSPAFKDDLNSGSIGLATQGGGLGRNLLQGWSFGEGVGLWFSAGNEVDLGVADFVAHMASDAQVRVIVLLMEGIKDGRRLTAALRLAQQHGKPVVALKIGHSEAGVRAAQSHTAAMAGSAAVNSAVLCQFGVIEVRDLNQLLAVASLLTRVTSQSGKGLCIYTFSGGTAALAADLAGTANLPMARFSAETNTALTALLPGFANIENPVDTTADVLRDPHMLAAGLQQVCADPAVGTVLFPIPMDYGAITDAMAETIVAVAAKTDTLIVPVWMSRRLSNGFHHMEAAGLLPFLSLSDAVSALACAIRWQAAAQTSACPANCAPVFNPAPCNDTRTLSEASAKALLRDAGIAIPEGKVVASANEAATYAAALGFPVAMKVASADIAHKTEAGGVKLGVTSAEAARHAYRDICAAVACHAPAARIDGILVERMHPSEGCEMLIAVRHDATFGLVMTLGLGGILVETLHDVVHRMLPLSVEDVRALPHELKHANVLQGLRGQPPVDVAALEALLLQVANFAWQRRNTLFELELNPVRIGVQGQGAIVLDALMTMTTH